MRPKLISPLLVLLLLTAMPASPNPFRLDKSEAPLVSMKMDAPFSSDKGWTLTVRTNGEAKLAIDAEPKPRMRVFKVSAKNLQVFRDVVSKQRFFELHSAYGGSVPDGDQRNITINMDGKSQSIILLHFRDKDPNLSEVRRAL